VPGQAVANYTFDNANRLAQITQGTTTVSFGYDNANRRTTLTLPNGVVTGYSYDAASQSTGMTYTLGNNPLGNLSYAYDNDGRRSSGTGTFARTGLPLAMNLGYGETVLRPQWQHDERRYAQLHLGRAEPPDADGPGQHGQFFV